MDCEEYSCSYRFVYLDSYHIKLTSNLRLSQKFSERDFKLNMFKIFKKVESVYIYIFVEANFEV